MAAYAEPCDSPVSIFVTSISKLRCSRRGSLRYEHPTYYHSTPCVSGVPQIVPPAALVDQHRAGALDVRCGPERAWYILKQLTVKLLALTPGALPADLQFGDLRRREVLRVVVRTTTSNHDTAVFSVCELSDQWYRSRS